MPEVICDTSPLQYLYQTELLDLLPTMYTRVTVPGAVVSELAAGRGRGVSLPDPLSLDWIDVRDLGEQPVLRLLADLGPGEREVLTLASETEDPLVIIDDALARRYARLLGVRMTGTLGLLIKAKHMGRIKAVAPVIDRLDASGFRLDPNTRLSVLDIAGEADDK